MDSAKEMVVTLLDVEGSVLLKQKGNKELIAHELSKHLEKASAGVYLVQLKVQERVHTIRVIKK